MKPIQDWNLTLGNYIISRCKHNGFLSAITKAERGYGKSMYNLKIMAYVFKCLYNCSDEEAWDKALGSMVFTPDQLLDKLHHNITTDNISPVICLDDATVHFSSMLYFVDLYETTLLNAMFDTIRTATHSLLINCPNKKRLLASLRNYDDHEITLYKEPSADGYNRRAVCIKWYSLPDGHRRFKKMYEDHFSCYVPKDVYERYIVKRKQYLEDISNELEEMRKNIGRKKKVRDVSDKIRMVELKNKLEKIKVKQEGETVEDVSG